MKIANEYLGELADAAYVKRIGVGSIDPNTPPTEEQLNDQVKRLNR